VVVPEPIQNFGVVGAEDRFEGYAFERTQLLSFIELHNISNVVFLSADFHGTMINNLAYQSLLPFAPGGTRLTASFPIPAFEIVSGPVAFYDGRFGPSVVGIAERFGLISAEQVALYDSLPVDPDPDGDLDDKDDFVKDLVDTLLDSFQYDPVGLDKNLPEAEGLIDAELLQGDYFATHSFAWTELDIDAETQDLTVTVWGIPAFQSGEVPADPEADILCRFVVHPK
jgi:hypothetical protein